jgi:flagellar hook-basal body complex protein FliE
MIQPLAPLPPLTPLGSSPTGGATSFGALLSEALASVNQAELNGQAALVGVAAGTTTLEAAVVATENASLMLNLAVGVRNEVVQAYQQIWSMQV